MLMQRPSTLLPAVLLALPLLASLAPARPTPATPDEALEQAMGQMSASLKTLEKGIEAGTAAAALEELARFEQAVIAAKAQVPPSAAGVDEKKRPEYVAEFRASLCEALKLACDAEIAVTRGKYKDAEKLVGKLDAAKSTGHGKFKKD
ncbi:MAG TPA: cytochrome b562 [Planctomycetota bacterium]